MSRSVRRLIATIGIAGWLVMLVPSFVRALGDGESPLGDRVWFTVFRIFVLGLLVLPYLILLREIRTGGVAWAVAVCLLGAHLTLGAMSMLEQDPLGSGFLLFYALLAGVGITLVGGAIDRIIRKTRPEPDATEGFTGR